MDKNSRIASLASRLVDPNDDHKRRRGEDEDDDDEALFAELEAEIENDDNLSMREQGLAILKREVERMKEMKASHHGNYSEVIDEKEVVRATANESRCVVHFYHTDFKRCEIMDRHLSKLAPKYFSTRFFRVFVENVPWLVERLGIKVLPCVICFVNGVSTFRFIGFEDLGNSDAFDTAVLELKLALCGVIEEQRSNPLDVSTSRITRENDEIFDLDD